MVHESHKHIAQLESMVAMILKVINTGVGKYVGTVKGVEVLCSLFHSRTYFYLTL